jgi:F-type H+-transporting ATPase subunit b
VLAANTTKNFLVPGPTFVVELAIFLFVLYALSRWVLPPLNRLTEDRQQTIARDLSEADEARKRAGELEVQHQELLEQGREEARQLRDEAAKAGERLRQELQKKGEEEYQRLVARASVDIEAATRKASEELRTQVAGLVVSVTERVLGQGIAIADQQRLIDRAIAEVESHAASWQGGLVGSSAGPGAGTEVGR